MAFDIIDLPFSVEALTPHISSRTTEIHYEKHYKKYIEKLNEIIKGSESEYKSLEEVILENASQENDIFQNAAQVWNHVFYWSSMVATESTPSQSLLDVIEDQFDSLDEFKRKFLTAAMDLFGAGWVWLVKKQDGDLTIVAMGNAGNPLTLGHIPLLVCDVWEHAYYLDYQNERKEYLNNFLKIVNWKFVEDNMKKDSSLFVNGHLLVNNHETKINSENEIHKH